MVRFAFWSSSLFNLGPTNIKREINVGLMASTRQLASNKYAIGAAQYEWGFICLPIAITSYAKRSKVRARTWTS